MQLNENPAIAGTNAVRALRLKKFKSGLPFMINTDDLPPKQCYLEYPDGIIKLATIINHSQNFTILKALSFSESQYIREKYHLDIYA